MSLFGDYIKEREDKEIIEDSFGFATYSFLADGIYIIDIYVAPDYRKSNVASKYADKIADIAKSKGLNKLYGSVCPAAKGSDASLKVLQAYGFKLDSLSNGLIVMKKDI